MRYTYKIITHFHLERKTNTLGLVSPQTTHEKAIRFCSRATRSGCVKFYLPVGKGHVMQLCVTTKRCICDKSQ